MSGALRRALREVRRTLLEEPVSPRVEAPADINRHHCRYVAETVVERVGDELDVEILEDGGRGYAHTWIVHDGRHYDAECIEGVADHRDLPFFRRHPDAALGVEPETTDPASLRHRGFEPLYPDIFSRGPSSGPSGLVSTADRRQALAGVVLGVLLFAAGLLGEWALGHHLLRETATLHTLFVDAEVIGQLIAVVSPIVFLVLLPAHRADVR